MQGAAEAHHPSLTSAALASRFGGGLVARLAASKALQSRQASAEPSVAAASREASGTVLEEAPPQPQPQPHLALEAGAALPSAPDDEALLLSGLLNTGGAATHTAAGLLGRLQTRAAAPGATPAEEVSHLDERAAEYSEQFSELLPEASGSAASLASCGSAEAGTSGGAARAQGGKLIQPPPLAGLGEDEPSAAEAAAAAAHGNRQRRSFPDAAEDTVLTGSPQASSASDSGVGSPPAGSLIVAQQQVCRAAGQLPGVHSPAAPPAGQLTVSSAVPASQLAASRPPTASRVSHLPKPPPKAVIPQRQWSFGAIPQATASIPSKAPAPQRRPAAAAGSSARPAFYTRAASPPPRASAAVALQPQGRAASSAKQSRRERLEQLAQPKRSAAPVRRQPAAVPAAANQTGRSASKPAAVAASKSALAATEYAGIAAWRPTQPDEPAAGCAVPSTHGAAPVMPNLSAASGRPGQGAWLAAAGQPGSSSGRRWPAALGQPLEGAELQRATGAYSEERFQAYLARLQQALAPHQQRRQQEAEDASAGVDHLVACVRQLGTGSQATAAAAACSEAVEPAVAAGQQVAEAAPPPTPPTRLGMMQAAGDDGEEAAKQLVSSDSKDTVLPTEALPRSPTERLLGCQQRLQQRPLTAPGLSCHSPVRAPGLPRPTTGSPAKVKPLMQVKGEQDAALKQLQQQAHPFRASPLPLSTMEPRYQRQEEQREARRQASHEQRRQQLLGQQRPFGFEERAAERAQRRQLLHGGGPGSAPLSAAATSGRPLTPTFHAQPVPLSTLEARYALLAAELQLQQQHRPRPATVARASAARPASGRPASPDRRPATAAARWRSLSRAGGGSTAGLAAPADTTCFVSVGSDKADGDRGPQPLVPAASTEQAGPASGSGIPCTASGSEQGASSSTAAAVQSAVEAGAEEPDEAAAGTQEAGEPDEAAAGAQEAGEPQYSEQWEVEAEAAESKALPPALAQLPPTGAVGDEGCPHQGSLIEADQLPVSGAELAPIKEQSAAMHDAAVQGSSGSPQLQPCAELSQPAAATAGDEGHPSGEGAAACPVAQRLGSRGSSFTGEPASPETGIAVPVACTGLGAVGAELLAAGSVQASVARGGRPAAVGHGPLATTAGGEERRDTPPQHIAARHQQVAAAARREVQAAFAKRGLRLDGL